MSRSEYEKWFKQQVVKVVRYQDWLFSAKGARLQLPDEPIDIVLAAIERVLEDVEADCPINCSLEEFFSTYLYRTVDAFRSRAKAKKRRFDRADYVAIEAESLPSIERAAACQEQPQQFDAVASRQNARVFRGATRRTRLRGAARMYGERMGEFAEQGLDKAEIAKSLKVSPRSVDKLRHRVARSVKQQLKKEGHEV